MNEFDPFRISAELSRTFQRLRAARAALQAGQASPDPFLGTGFPGKTLRDQILSLPPTDPLRSGLLAWTDELLEARINFNAFVLEQSARLEDTHPPRAPLDQPASLAVAETLLLRACASPGEDDKARALFRFLRDKSIRLGAVRRERWTRRREIEERLSSPLSPLLEWWQGEEPAPEDAARLLALEVLRTTRDAAEAWLAPGYVELLRGSLALGASEGWPARLAPETMLALLGGDWLTRGLALGTRRLPERQAPSSFVSATVLLGHAVSLAGRPRDLPFVVSARPAELEAWLLGETLAAYLVGLPFLRRRLGLGPAPARSSQRSLELARLCRLRILAAETLLADAAQQGAGALDQVNADIEAQLVAEPLGAPLGLLAATPHSHVRLVALLLALGREQDLTLVHDEDWLDNPRARDQLRSELGLPARVEVQVADARRGLELLCHRLATN